MPPATTLSHPTPPPSHLSPLPHQRLPRNLARLVLKWIAAVEVIRVEKAAIHVCTTACLSCEERTVNAARLLVVVYVRIENLFVKYERGALAGGERAGGGKGIRNGVYRYMVQRRYIYIEMDLLLSESLCFCVSLCDLHTRTCVYTASYIT